MKNIIKLLVGSIAVLTVLVITLPSCDDIHEWDTTLYEVGTFNATSTGTSILGGETVTFTDLSTNIYSREWSFLGGDPASSTDSIVTVRYDQGSVDTIPYIAKLNVKYIDNQIQTKEFYINVEGNILQSYSIFTEDASKTIGTYAILENNNAYEITRSTVDAFEGNESIYFNFDGIDTWGTMGSIVPEPYGTSADISAFKDGTYNLAIKTNCTDTMLIRVHSAGGAQKAIVTLDPVTASYGLARDGNWHFLSIPMADFLANNPELDLTNITQLLVFRSGPIAVTADEDWDFWVDHFYLEEGEAEK